MKSAEKTTSAIHPLGLGGRWWPLCSFQEATEHAEKMKANMTAEKEEQEKKAREKNKVFVVFSKKFFFVLVN